MTGFSLELDEHQRTLQTWLHGFSTDVIRPAAAEWDEREETPWPVLQEAARVGIYSLDFFATAREDPTGLSLPIAMEELFWGDAGIGLSIVFSVTIAGAARASYRRREGSNGLALAWATIAILCAIVCAVAVVAGVLVMLHK